MGLEIADVFRRFGETYLSRYGTAMLPSHRRAIHDIVACRTPEMGGHRYDCADCGRTTYVYHGCRNRSCPACHTAQTQKWLTARQAELLPCGYFHVTATVPEGLRAIFRSHQKVMYGMLMQVAAEAVLTLCRDPKHMGGTPGLLAVLHTWTGQLDYHPHVHFLVTGGGISADGQKWRPSKRNFLVPVRALSRLIRAKLRLTLQEHHATLYAQIPDSVWRQEWVADCRPWGDGEKSVLDYLARYVFRIAITNRRLLAMDERTVTFQFKDRKQNRWRTCRLEGLEFMRRYLQHVLPKGFHKVRYYGLWHSSSRQHAVRVRHLLRLAQTLPTASTEPPASPARTLTSAELANPTPRSPSLRCTHCGSSRLIHVAEIRRPRKHIVFALGP